MFDGFNLKTSNFEPLSAPSSQPQFAPYFESPISLLIEFLGFWNLTVLFLSPIAFLYQVGYLSPLRLMKTVPTEITTNWRPLHSVQDGWLVFGVKTVSRRK